MIVQTGLGVQGELGGIAISICLLTTEAVRKGDVQEPMRERPEARLGLLAG